MQAPPKLDHDNFPSLAMNQLPAPSPPGAPATEHAPAQDGQADGHVLSSSSSGSMEGSAEASPGAGDSKPARSGQEGPAAWGGAAAARSECCLWGFCCEQHLSGTHHDTGEASELLPFGCTPVGVVGGCGQQSMLKFPSRSHALLLDVALQASEGRAGRS